MMSTMDKIINILVLDDKFGKINSHWAFSTEKLIVIDRIYYDDILFEEKVLNLINEVSIDAIGFSGRNAIEAELKLEKYLRNKSLNAYIDKMNAAMSPIVVTDNNVKCYINNELYII